MKDISPETLARLGTRLTFSDPALLTPHTAWSKHLPFAFWLVGALQPAVLVELGVHTGVSYCGFCQAVQQTGLATLAYGVDTWAGDMHAGAYEESVLGELRAHHDPRYSGFSRLVQAEFDKAREHFPDGSIDLLHIDGLHTYEAVRHDFETWVGALSTRGVVLFHDISIRERDFGVWRLWAELRDQYPSLEFPFGCGLGVLGVGANLPASMRWLLLGEQRTDDNTAIIRFFDVLGDRLAARSESARAQLLSAEQKRLLEERDAELSACRVKIASLENVQAELDNLKSTISWRLTRPLRKAKEISRVYLRQMHKSQAFTLMLKAWQNPRKVPRALLQLIKNTGPMRSVRQSLTDGAEFTLKPIYPLRNAWYDEKHPQVSIIVLNYNKPNMTLACLDSIWEHSKDYRYEVILVDNGSYAENFLQLAPAKAGARILRIKVNRYFGEGNNLGFEASLGRYIIFLNNDVTVTPNWLHPLIHRLEHSPNIGATGPKMVYPDGRLQEAGAEVRPDGSSNQLGKGGDPNDPAHCVERDVMYVSAAAVAMRRETFEEVLGFDLCYEPAYYEDTDLCMKIRQLGLRVVYCPESCIVHHENATSRDLANILKLNTIIPLNQERFLARWRPALEDKNAIIAGVIPKPAQPLQHKPGQPRLLLYTPFNLVPGGGERYLLTIAAGLARKANVTLATQHPYSRIRLRTMGRELSLDLDQVHITTLDQTGQLPGFDYSIVMGNEVLPNIPGKALRNFFICQFPFPVAKEVLADRWDYLEGYEKIIVYSKYAEKHYRSTLNNLGATPSPVTVVSPPVGMHPLALPPQKRPIIIGVGRFFVGGHTKRQDLMIEAFRKLVELFPTAELHLAGSLPAEAEHRAYYSDLQKKALGLPVFFHLNVPPKDLSNLYAEASLYWHLSGFGVDEAVAPHQCEHFGITVVEAMTAGCIPLVVKRGGPPAIIEEGTTGYSFESLNELVNLSVQILTEPLSSEKVMAMRMAAIRASAQYTEPTFIGHFKKLLDIK